MPTRRSGVVIAVCTVVFVALTVLVATGVVDDLDNAVWHFADRHDSPAGVTSARLLTDALQPAVDAILLLAGAALLARRERRLRPLSAALTVLVAVSAVVLGIKFAVDRPLPHSHHHGARGFPSGHTAAAACFLGTLAVLISARRPAWRRRLLGLVAGLTVLVALALVYAGFHWLTDTVASAALGVAIVGTLSLDRLGRVLIHQRNGGVRTCRRRRAPARTPR
jgi:membrane-associated phospholipid phosphatase